MKSFYQVKKDLSVFFNKLDFLFSIELNEFGLSVMCLEVMNSDPLLTFSTRDSKAPFRPFMQEDKKI